MRTVYLDNNATTRVIPEVLEEMLPFYTEHYGNASSAHRLGARPAVKLREARSVFAGHLHCDESEIIFTGCGSEADNLAIRGVLDASPDKRHIVTTTVEHTAVANVVRRMADDGYDVTWLEVDRNGALDLEALGAALRDDTALVSIMSVNNETGVVFPMADIARIVKSRGIPLHTDAVQVVGKLPLDLSELPVDLIAISGHKFHGPKGVGVLFCRKGTPWLPLLVGAGQERGRRPGTENVAGIAGVARAFELAVAGVGIYESRVRLLRDRFEAGMLERIADIGINGARSPRTPNASNVTFHGVDGRSLLTLLDEVGICVSIGSACKTGAGLVSAVLLAMGLSPEDAASSLRFSLGGETSEADIDYTLEHIPPIVERLRSRR